jgi:hypothetical protein
MISNLTGDVEYPSTGCIHNMYESLLYFDNVNDPELKSIFDKSNRTYWKASIETEAHYIDAGGGYYGVWHPRQLVRDFILLHAQPDHSNHIYSGLRTSGHNITGITSILVYKNNLG